jgi:hypothetical protein
MWREFGRFVPPLLLLVLLGACGSIAKGVTEAVLERSEREDTRQCHIEGLPTTGLTTLLDAQGESEPARELKVLMIHGIGRHSPGYSGRLTENLMPALGLTLKSESRKEIVLWEHEVSDKPVGTLTAHLYMSPDRSRRLVFYELTWSDVFEEERQAVAFDNSKEYAFRRTQLNGYLKRFFNDNIPDAFIYLSESRAKIFASVQQSYCWMTSGDWEDIPNRISETCRLADRDRLRYVLQDDLVFLTHSLGSRIAIDVLQDDTEVVARAKVHPKDWADSFRDLEVRIYMLANQLPLLGLSIRPPSVQGQIQDYCTPEGKLVDKRALKKLNIYAFNDPNDLLSYPIPPHLVDRYVDSRLCPSVTNISINVTRPIDLFGISKIANPAAAHDDYDQDERVMEIIARGVGQKNESKLIADGCTWVRTTAP